MKGLVNYKEMLAYAQKNHFTIGGFNSFNLESVRGVITAAEEMNTPIIVQLYSHDLDHATPWGMKGICEAFASKAKVPVALGLDHGVSFEQAKLCIESGFTGVMIDLSTHDYEHNVSETRRVVELARKYNASVEAELGTLYTGDVRPEDMVAGFTDPQVAKQFVLDTQVDCLAVSIGTAHGLYSHECRIDFKLLEELIKVVPCPIVVHGGSGTPDEDVLRMVEMGIAKLNVGTDLFRAYNDDMLTTMADWNGTPWKHPKLGADAAIEAVHRVAVEKLKLLTRYRTDI